MLSAEGPEVEASDSLGIQFDDAPAAPAQPVADACAKCLSQRYRVDVKLCLSCANGALDTYCRDKLDASSLFDGFLSDRMDEGRSHVWIAGQKTLTSLASCRGAQAAVPRPDVSQHAEVAEGIS